MMAKVLVCFLVLCSASLPELRAQAIVGYWSFDGNLNDSQGTNNAQVNQGNPAFVSGSFGNKFFGHFWGGGMDTLAETSVTYSTDTWVMAMVVYDGTDVIVYQDASLIAQKTRAPGAPLKQREKR
jgi:hypothetical protein